MKLARNLHLQSWNKTRRVKHTFQLFIHSFNRTEEAVCFLSVQPLQPHGADGLEEGCLSAQHLPQHVSSQRHSFLTAVSRTCSALTHSLTLTSSPSVWRQCCLNAGKTFSLRALRSTTLSAHKHLLKVWTLFILSLIIIMPSSLTLGIGAQVDFHAGLHLIFSRGHGKGRRLLLEEGKKSRSTWKRNRQQAHSAS